MRPAADRSQVIRSCAACGLWTARLVAAVFVLQVGFAVTEAADITANSPSKVAITEDARAKARDIFTERCATCHGIDGHGNGPAAANLRPKPAPVLLRLIALGTVLAPHALQRRGGAEDELLRLPRHASLLALGLVCAGLAAGELAVLVNVDVDVDVVMRAVCW